MATTASFLVSLGALMGTASSVRGDGGFKPLAGTYGPSGDIVFTRPNLRVEIWAPDGRPVTTAEMRIDGQTVRARYDVDQRALVYVCDAPLSVGEHSVLCRVGFQDTLVFRAGWKFRVLPGAVNNLPAQSPQSAAFLRLVNERRQNLGLPDMVSDPMLECAASRHAAYCATNGVISHEECPGKAGFFGESVQQRLFSLGWIGAATEGATGGEPTMAESLANLFDSPYHRIPFLQPGVVPIGSGHSSDGVVADFGMNGGRGATLSPCDGQKNVPVAWSRLESPNPLRIHPGSMSPTGYPIVVALFGADRKLVSFKATLRSRGKEVPVLINSPENDEHLQSDAFVIPASPLDPGQTYEVSIEGIDETGASISNTWSFTTVARPS